MSGENEETIDLESTDLPGEPTKEELEALAAAEGGEGEGEGADPAKAEGADAGADGTERHVPYNRFKDVNQRRIAAEQREAAAAAERDRLLAIIETQQRGTGKQEAAPPPFDFDKASEELAVATIEGDVAKVREINRQIRAADRAEMAAEHAKREESILARAASLTSGQALSTAAAELKAKYPFLDNKSDEADPEAISDVIDMRDMLISRGMAPAEALRRATEKVAKLNGYEAAGKKPAIDPAAAAAAKKAAAARNAGTVGKQPPAATGGHNNTENSNTVDATKMDKDKWAQLPQKERDAILYT